MALRGAAARRSPDGPLVGVLRDLDRRQRKPARRRRGTRDGQQGPAGPAGPPGPPGAPPAAGTVRSTADGRATWTLPEPMPAPPVVGALPAAGDGGPVWCVLEQATGTRVTVRVWRWAGGRPEPADGVTVHLTATPQTA